jgi:hypothetical protein
MIPCLYSARFPDHPCAPLQYTAGGKRLCSMRPIYTLAFLVLLAIICTPAQAQVRWMVYAGAGTSHNVFKDNARDSYLDYYAYKGKDGLYILPQAGVAMRVPLGRKFIFETGAGYTRKQFRAAENKIMEANTQYQLTIYNESKTRLDYLSFPFTLSYIFPVSEKNTLQLGAGVSYGFLLRASQKTYSRQTAAGYAPDEYKYENKVPKGLIQTSKIFPGTLNIFDTGIKLQLSYVWHSKLMLRLSSEYSLYTIYLREDRNKPDLQLWYSGLSIGYIL